MSTFTCFLEAGRRDLFHRGGHGTDIHDSVAHFEGEPIVRNISRIPSAKTDLFETVEGMGVERVVSVE